MQPLTPNIDIRWGDTRTSRLVLPIGTSTLSAYTSDLIFVPERGQPRGWILSFTGETNAGSLPGVTLDKAIFEMYFGVGQVIQQVKFDVTGGFVPGPFTGGTQAPASTIRCRFFWQVSGVALVAPTEVVTTASAITAPFVALSYDEMRRDWNRG